MGNRASIAGLLLLLLGCGPGITIDTDDASTGSVGSVGTTSATAPNPVTSGTPPSPTTIASADSGPLDTGPDDSDGFPPDFPEYCSTIEQDCPPGFKCMPFSSDGGASWNDVMCVPIVDDPNGPGEPCMVEGSGVSGFDDCDGTSMCWNVDPETNEGECIEFCIGNEQDASCPNPCDQCSISGDGVLTLCLPTCDPITQNCDPGQACYPINENFACAPDASPDGTELGSPCEFINACPPGLACLSTAALPDCMGASGCCAPFCPVGGADPCPGLLPGTVCTPWFDEGQGPAAGCLVTEPGVCVVPDP